MRNGICLRLFPRAMVSDSDSDPPWWTTIYNLDQGIVSWFVDRLFAPIHCLYVCVCVVQIKHLRRPVDHDVTCCVAPLKLETPLQSEGHLSHALPVILH